MNGFYSEEELKDFRFKKLGRNVLISKKCSIYGAEEMSFGDNVRIDDFCLLVGRITVKNYVHIAAFSGLHASSDAMIILEDFSGISSNVTIYAASDNYSGEFMTNPMLPSEYKHIISTNITLHRHSLVGTASVLLPGALLLEGSVLGAMSLLAKEVEAWSINVGIPAKKIRDRKRDLLQYEKYFLSNIKKSEVMACDE